MNLPNLITVFRILLVPVFIGSLFYWRGGDALRLAAACIFVVASATDALDGALARKLNQQSRVGALLDPIADKLLLTSAFFGLAFFSGIPIEYRSPAWLTITVISRDVILVVGALTIWMMVGRFDANPNKLGKITTVFQMVFIAAVLFDVAPAWRGVLAAATCALTVVSGLRYIHEGFKLLSKVDV